MKVDVAKERLLFFNRLAMGSVTIQDSSENPSLNTLLSSDYPSSQMSEAGVPTRNGFEPIAIVGMGEASRQPEADRRKY